MIMLPAVILGLVAAAYGFTAWKSRAIEARFPNIGQMTNIGGYSLNALHLPAASSADLPPIVFIHGASGNLRDQAAAFRHIFEGRAELLFVDRPGHGYSERGGPRNDLPDGQADAVAKLMERRGIRRAIIVGHSFGGAIASSFAVDHPDRTAGLLLLSPATHPWNGDVDWYYHLAARPYLGRLFTRLLTLPAGLALLDKATRSVFHPNHRPESYLEDGAPGLVLRPANFRSNAIDVLKLNGYLRDVAPRYKAIQAPTVIITGDTDAIVSVDIHSRQMAADVAGAELVVIKGLGHKPDYLAADVVVAAVEKLAGLPRDLQATARRVEAHLAAAALDPEPELDMSIEKA
ncbi:alpha/beta hydrolase [Neorhizobium lilium]|uniref:Alpha/beta hydrolase n=1 Tax=Neorhizobium lilium TaxID=2503024 RepID=A0A3S3VKZ9_9HYPH|nr:alpha/beta hydrolase [Neorhizobium lilium]RWX79046.1 alpha/beta hydrolase [Neorhizobium lilium]